MADNMIKELPPEEILTPALSRAARAFLDISQSQLAALAGVSDVTISRFESGQGGCRARTLMKIRKVFKREGIAIHVTKNSEGLTSYQDKMQPFRI